MNSIIIDLTDAKLKLEYFQNFYGKNERVSNVIKILENLIQTLTQEVNQQDTSFKLIEYFSEELKSLKKKNKDLEQEMIGIKIMLNRYNPRFCKMEDQ